MLRPEYEVDYHIIQDHQDRLIRMARKPERTAAPGPVRTAIGSYVIRLGERIHGMDLHETVPAPRHPLVRT